MRTRAEREKAFRAENRKIWHPDPEPESTELLPYEPDTCDTCGREMVEGDWPYCKGDMNDHITRRSSRNAQKLLTVVYENSAGKVWVPTSDHARPPKGYERVELTTLQQVDRYMADLSRVQDERFQIYEEQERIASNEYLKQARRDMESHGFAWHNPQTGEVETLPGIFSMTPQGRDMYREALERYGESPRLRPLPVHVEAQFFDHGNIKDRD